MDEQSTGTGKQLYPDGHVPDAKTLRMRTAARALRLHLDDLPAVFNFNSESDQFLVESAFPFARWRFGCADALIGAGMGGTIMGALARSLFVDGLRWQWISEAPTERRAALLGSLLEERNRIAVCLEENDASCPNITRWFSPLNGITNLSGSLSWLSAPEMPNEDELLDRFLASPSAGPTTPPDTSEDLNRLLTSGRRMLRMSGLRGAVRVLAHAGHGNLLGLQSSLTSHGVPGHDLRADHEALFMHVSAVGVTVTLMGVCLAAPESWPEEIDQFDFLESTMRLTKEVVAAATSVHGLGEPKSIPAGQTKVRASRRPPLLRPSVLLEPDSLLPDILSADQVISAVEEYDTFVHSWHISPWEHGNPKLATVLAYSGAHSTFDTVMSTFDQNAAVTSVFGARMLLEEAARFTWLTQDPSEQNFLQRSTRYFDEFRHRKKKTIELFAGNGIALHAAKKFFDLPDMVVAGPEVISKGRKPLPPISEMLLDMGKVYPEPGWLTVAYSLLSQVTHSSPLGHLHMARYRDGTLSGNEISPEMLALTLDVACLGSARLIGLSSLFLAQGSDSARDYARGLEQRALAAHDKARLVHGLD